MTDPARVLIVDDDESVRGCFSRTLAELGYACESAPDGQAGWEALNRGEFAVALLDLKMPKMNGIELLGALAESGIDTVPIVLTGNGEIASAVEAMKLGAYDFIEKPCRDAILHGAVQRAGSHRQAARRAREMASLLERWESIFDAWPDLIVVLDDEYRIIVANRSAAEKLAAPKQKLCGRSAHEILCFGAHPPIDCPLHRPLADSNPSPIEFHHKPWGIDFELTSVRLSDPSGHPWGSLHIARDISDRKKAQAKLQRYHKQLQDLTSELVLAEQRERRQLAAGLHDGVGQLLALAKLKLNMLRDSLPAADPNVDLAAEIRELVQQAIHSTRSLTFDLSPPVLYEVGLEAALSAFLDHIRRNYGLASSFESDGNPVPLSDDLRVLLFQTVRELVVNAVKHAEASLVRVSLHGKDGQVRIGVGDDGKGFNPEDAMNPQNHNHGFGLFNIRERVTRLGGNFQIRSAPGAGTRIELTAPVKPPTMTT